MVRGGNNSKNKNWIDRNDVRILVSRVITFLECGSVEFHISPVPDISLLIGQILHLPVASGSHCERVESILEGNNNQWILLHFDQRIDHKLNLVIIEPALVKVLHIVRYVGSIYYIGDGGVKGRNGRKQINKKYKNEEGKRNGICQNLTLYIGLTNNCSKWFSGLRAEN